MKTIDHLIEPNKPKIQDTDWRTYFNTVGCVDTDKEGIFYFGRLERFKTRAKAANSAIGLLRERHHSWEAKTSKQGKELKMRDSNLGIRNPFVGGIGRRTPPEARTIFLKRGTFTLKSPVKKQMSKRFMDMCLLAISTPCWNTSWRVVKFPINLSISGRSLTKGDVLIPS